MPVISAIGRRGVEGNSGGEYYDFVVTLDSVATAPVTFRYTTVDGTATEIGGDYDRETGTATIAAGESSVTIRVWVRGDTLIEGDETFSLILTDPSNGATFAGGASALVATGTIYDNDGGAPNGSAGDGAAATQVFGPASASGSLPTVTVHNVAHNEGNSGGGYTYFLVTVDQAPTAPITFRYFVEDRTASDQQGDYDTDTGTITLAAGETSTVIPVWIQGDTLNEGDETFNLVLHNIENGVFAGGASALIATGTIIDDDGTSSGLVGGVGAPAVAAPDAESAHDTLPTLRISDGARIEGASGGGYMYFLITLDEAPTTPVTFNYDTVDGTAADALSDYNRATGSVTMSAGQQSTWLRIWTVGDALDEGDETFSLILTDVTGAVFEGNAAALAATGTIKDDDGGAVSGPAGISGAGDALRIADSASDTVPTLTVMNTATIEGQSGGAYTTIVLTLSEAPTSPVTVQWRTIDGTAGEYGNSDYNNDWGTVTFAAGQTSATVDVYVYGDTLLEGNEQFEVLFTDVTGAVFEGNAAALTSTVTILDNDAGPVSGSGGVDGAPTLRYGPVSASDSVPTLDVQGSIVFENSTAYFLVTLDSAPTSPVTFNYAVMDGSASRGLGDFANETGSITIDPGQTSVRIAVDTYSDTLAEGNETFQLMLTGLNGAVFANNASALIATGTILDDDSGSVVGAGGIAEPALPIFSVSSHASLPTATIHDATVIEGSSSGTARFLVTLDKPATTDVVIYYRVEDGTASEVQGDHSQSQSSLTIPAGRMSGYIAVTVSNDTIIEDTETFSVVGYRAQGAVFAGGANMMLATGTILDDDSGPVSGSGGVGGAGDQIQGPADSNELPVMRVISVSADEGNSYGSAQPGVYIILSKPATSTITFDASTSSGTATSGTDFANINSSYTIQPGSVGGFISIPIIGDTAIESDEQFTFTLSNLTGAVFESGGASAAATITIRDDDGGGSGGNNGAQSGPQFTLVDAPLATQPIYGDANANTLTGTNGNDVVYGEGGNDTIYGLSGNDSLVGGTGSDQLDGGLGADALNGGAGFDFARYDYAAGAVTAHLMFPHVNSGDAAGDKYASIEGLVGSNYGDFLAGDNVANALYGLNGNDSLYGLFGADSLYGGAGVDFLEGGAGADLLDGGDGFDFARHDNATSGVTANLQSPFVNAGDAAGDSYVSIEGLVGSYYNDTLAGNAGANEVYGLGGNDTIYGLDGADILSGDDGNDSLNGGLGGDALIGGAGFDYARYDDATTGLTAHLALPNLNTGEAAGDSYSGVEGIVGTSYADILAGDAGDNWIYGGDGYDQIYGAEGNDFLFAYLGPLNFMWGGLGADVMTGGLGLDFARYDYAATGVVANLGAPGGNAGEAAGDQYNNIEGLVGSTFGDTLVGDGGNNEIYGNSGDDWVYGQAGNDFVFGDAGTDQLEGGAGADLINGGEGFDFARYEYASTGVTAHLLYAHVNTGDAAGDGYQSIEGLVGSNFADTLAGDNANNTIYGLNGNDTIYGLGGADLMYGGGGADIFAYVANSDSTPDARDYIGDFQSGSDKIDLSGLYSGGSDQLAIYDLGGGTYQVNHDQGGNGSVETAILVNGFIQASDIILGGAAPAMVGEPELLDEGSIPMAAPAGSDMFGAPEAFGFESADFGGGARSFNPFAELAMTDVAEISA